MPNIIKGLRVNKGMTQEELGAYLGVKKSAVQKYESGAIVNLKADTIRKLCDLFNVPPGYFIYGYDAYTISEKRYISISQKWQSSKKFAEVVVASIELNEEGLEKVKTYIEDLKGEYFNEK